MKTDQLGLLRDIKDDELQLMLTMRNQPSVRENMYTQHEISMEEHMTWWGQAAVSLDQKYFMYERLGSPLGIAAFTSINIHNKESDWIFYASDSVPPGTGSRMEFLMLEHAFTTLRLNKLYCEVLAINASVIKLHKKFGFSIEGVLKDRHKIQNTFVDSYRLVLLSSDWLNNRQFMYEKLLAQIR